MHTTLFSLSSIETENRRAMSRRQRSEIWPACPGSPLRQNRKKTSNQLLTALDRNEWIPAGAPSVMAKKCDANVREAAALVAAEVRRELEPLLESTVPVVLVHQAVVSNAADAVAQIERSLPQGRVRLLSDSEGGEQAVRAAWLVAVPSRCAVPVAGELARQSPLAEMIVVGRGPLPSLPVPAHPCRDSSDLVSCVLDLCMLLGEHRRAAAPGYLRAAIGARIAADHSRAVARELGYEPPPVRMPSSLRDIERQAVQRALDATGGQKRRAAHLLGVSPGRLYRLLGREVNDD